ncbi:MAG: PAS domain S-box protein [Alphaproteobacteria bacterium]|nr:PAS domain S-box protein [Alphaproteobacteria bacterium]
MLTERLTHALIEELDGAVTVSDMTAPDMPLVYVNQAFEKLTGYRAEEALGRNCRFLQGPDTDASSLRLLRQAVSAGRPLRLTLLNYRKSGEPFWNELRLSPHHDGDGRLTHYFGFQLDVTERLETQDALNRARDDLEREVTERTRELEESRARFEDLVEACSDWVWEMDEHLRFTFVSARLTKITGIPVDAVVGRTRRELLAGMDPDQWHPHQADLDARRPFMDFRYPVNRPDGSPVYCAISGKPLFDAEGRFRGYRGTGRDCTTEQEYLEAQQAAVAAAQEANRAKSQFLARMSHELRTPLNAIIGFSEALRTQGLKVSEARRIEYAQYINESGNHLLDIISDILEMAKIEAGKLELHEDWLDPEALLNECLHVVTDQAHREGLLLSIEIEAGLPPVFGDRRALKQSVLNLLSNAVKFTPRGGHVTLAASRPVDKDLVIEVRDSGVGIPADELGWVTQPFAQSRETAGRSHLGTGLGLAIVKSLVEKHGGRLTVESEQGRGSRISLTIPRCRMRAEASELSLHDTAG